MSHRLSVLQRAKPSDVRSDPFPHLVVKDALPAELYDELAASFPSPQQLGQDSSQNNSRWNYPTRKVRRNTALPQIWRDFIEYQASQAFFDEIAAIFQPHITALYPERFPDLESLRRMKAGVRKVDDFRSRDILIDAMISGNTPVSSAGSVRSTHIDNGDKLYSGLFYMRPESYDAIGGDLTISRFKPSFDTLDKKVALYDGSYVDDANVDHVSTITYDKNTLVLFINSLQSLHGVTVRQPSDKTRLFVNLVGEIDPPLYQIQSERGPARYLRAGEQVEGEGWLDKVRKLLRVA